jgi:hypothetical protein
MRHQKSKIFSLKSIVILCVLLAGASSQAQEDPGLVKAAEGEPGFYYTIQKGDTLWDLSRKFYNSQWDWPGLWEMNKEIKNPHWIYPGKKIRVFLNTQAPSKAMEQQAPAPPQPSEKTVDPITPTFVYPGMDRVGFIKKTQEKSLGTIIRERDKHLMISKDDIIYIKPADEGALKQGQIYHIFNVEQIKETFDRIKFTGVKHILKARVKILKDMDTYWVGKITAAYKDVGAGDMLMPYLPRAQALKIREKNDSIDAVLVCSETNTLMINDRRIAFINKGRQDNVLPGQVYTIYQSQTEKSFFGTKDKISIAPLLAGRLIVLHSEKISATVMVVSSRQGIHPGDMVN